MSFIELKRCKSKKSLEENQNRFEENTSCLSSGLLNIFFSNIIFTFSRVNGTQSILDYVPRTEMDYGSVLCWASNSVGRQNQPCVFHIVPAGECLK